MSTVASGAATGALAGLAVAVPLGPVGVHLVGLSARTSLRTGSAAALGVATADGLYAAVAVVGGAGLGRALAPAVDVVRPVCALVLLVAAVRVALQPPTAASTVPPAARAYGALLALTLANPATVLSFLALVVGDGGLPGGAVQGLAFVLGALLASAAWQLLLAGGGALAGRALVRPAVRRATSVLSGVLVAGLAVRLLLG